jgi:integrase
MLLAMQPQRRMAMPVYQEMRGGEKLKGKWRVRVAVNGRKMNRTVTGTKASAKEAEAEMRLAMTRPKNTVGEGADPELGRPEGTLVPSPDVQCQTEKSFFDFSMNEYKEQAQKRLAKTTWRVRKYHLAILIEFFGAMPLTEVKTRHVEEFKDFHRERGIKDTTINDYLKSLSAVLGYAEDQEYPHGQPKIRRFPEVKNADKGAWSAEDVALLLKKTLELAPHIYSMVVCLAQTGMRKGEVINLQWQDVDIVNQTICIQPHEDWCPKSRRPRTIPITPAFMPFLKRKRTSSKWVFPKGKTGHKFESWPQRYFDFARKAAGLIGGPHQLRHFYATHMVLRTKDLFVVGRLLGHSHHTVTERYAHLLDEHLDRAREAFSLEVLVGPAEVEASMRWGADPEKVRKRACEKVRS